MNTDDLIATLEAYFRDTEIPVICAYLYGSYARGEARPGSDLDIAVLLPEGADTGLRGPLTDLRGELERLAGRETDLVDLRRAPVDLIHRVLRDGRLLADRRPAERIRFEVDARNRYFDLLPHLQRYRRGRAA